MRQNVIAAGIDIALGKRAVIGIGIARAGQVFGYGIRGMAPGPHVDFFDERLRELPDRIVTFADRHSVNIVIVEKPMAMGKHISFSLRWLYGAVISRLMGLGVPVISLPTCTIRRLSAGKGNIKKDAFVAMLAHRFKQERKHDILEAMAYAELGYDIAAGKYPAEPVSSAYRHAQQYLMGVEEC